MGWEQSKDAIPAGSLIGKLTAAAQAARDAFPAGTVAVNGGEYRMREDWCDVMDRAAARFGGPAPADEPIRYARALVMARQG